MLKLGMVFVSFEREVWWPKERLLRMDNWAVARVARVVRREKMVLPTGLHV